MGGSKKEEDDDFTTNINGSPLFLLLLRFVVGVRVRAPSFSLSHFFSFPPHIKKMKLLLCVNSLDTRGFGRIWLSSQ